MMEHSPTPFDLETVESHLHALVEGRVLSRSTGDRYRRELAQFVAECTSTKGPDVLAWIGTGRRGQPLSPNNFNRRLAIVRGYLEHLVEVGDLPANPLAGTKRLQVPAIHRSPVTPEELGRLLEAADEQRVFPWISARDRAMIHVLYATGLRVSEITDLDIQQLDPSLQLLRGARRKGAVRSDEYVPAPTVRALQRWASARPTTSSTALFVSRDLERMSPRAVQRRLQLLKRRSGVQADTNPHALRHGHATTMAASANLRVVQASMRHASVKTTMIYVHIGDQDVVDARDALPSIEDLPKGGGDS